MARLEILAPHLFHALLAGPAGARDQVAALLARGELTLREEFDVEHHMLAWFGLSDSRGVAAMTAAIDLPGSGAAHWLRLDPVHLRADPTRLILFDAETVGLTAAEADELLAHLRAGLGADTPLSRGAAPGRWYLRLDAPLDLPLASPHALRGRAVEEHLGELRRARAISRLLTEAQMLLYEAPLNLRRAAAGQAPINSLWPWGGGATPALTPPAGAAVLGDDALLAACARHAAVACHTSPDALAAVLAQGARTLLLVDHREAAECDLQRCMAQWLAPLGRALVSGALDTVELHGHRASVTLTRAARWRLWRRPAAFVRKLGEAATPA